MLLKDARKMAKISSSRVQYQSFSQYNSINRSMWSPINLILINHSINQSHNFFGQCGGSNPEFLIECSSQTYGYRTIIKTSSSSLLYLLVLSALPLLERKVEETPFFFSVLLVSSGGRETLLRRRTREEKNWRCEQDLNLCGKIPLDFESNALTTRPSQPIQFTCSFH